jgi:hypothetical protein
MVIKREIAGGFFYFLFFIFFFGVGTISANAQSFLDTVTGKAEGTQSIEDSFLNDSDGEDFEEEDEEYDEEYDDEDFDEDEFWEEYEGPDIGVIYNEKSESDFLTVETDSEIIEYHYLNRIKENNLVNILTDLLKRITQDKYIWASDFSVEYGEFEDIALIYKVEKYTQTAYGMAQFPLFRIVISGKKEPDNTHIFDISSYRTLSTMVMKFIFVMGQIETDLGISQYDLLNLFGGSAGGSTGGSTDGSTSGN